VDPTRILIIDDELAVVQGCSRTLVKSGHEVHSALNSSEAITRITGSEEAYDVIFLDLKLAGDPDTELLKRLKQLAPYTAIIFIIGPASIAAAIEALRQSHSEFLAKPFTPEDITTALRCALLHRTMLLQSSQAQENSKILELEELVWIGPTMHKIAHLAATVAPTGSNILIIGADGTGKMNVAEAIHRASPRRLDPFVMFEPKRKKHPSISEQLFGYVAKEFGSSKNIPGKIEEAGKGTLYMTEITTLSANDQSRLIIAIKERRRMPLRGTDSQTLSCRIIFATEENLHDVVAQGKLIEDFYYHLEVFPIYLPSLPERIEDIPALSYQLMRRFAVRYARPIVKIDEKLMARLQVRNWQKNLRELSECIERMISVCEGDSLELDHYKQVMGEGTSSEWSGLPPTTSEELKTVKKKLRQTAVAEVERAFVSEALRRSSGNISLAARMVGMQRRNFQTLIKRYGILVK